MQPSQLEARLPLRDELYLLAHHEKNGAPLVHVPGLSLAMACAAVIDLALAQRLNVVEQQVVLGDSAPTGDTICDQLLQRLRMAPPDHRDLSLAVNPLSADVYHQTCLHLELTGVIVRQARRRFGQEQIRYRMTPKSRTHRQFLTSVLYHTTQVGSRNTDDQRRALCALVAMLRLERLVAANVSTAVLIGQLRAAMEGFYGLEGPAVAEVLAFAEQRIGYLAVSAVGN